MSEQIAQSPWPHRWAWLLVCATFPLLWVGGLITTTDAGMAVPDWPNTYGYNMLLYPWATWMFGPWDLFIEHGHRLLATGVGLLTIAFLVVVCRCDQRGWLRTMAVGALVLVILQGVLGGLRVEINARHLALAHGITGPLFFAYCAALVVMTSRSSRDAEGGFRRRYLGLPLLLFLQLILGATLRHTPEEGTPWAFALHVQCHLAMAAAVALSIWGVALRASTGRVARWLVWAMSLLVVVQICLGVGAWYCEYRLPDWAAGLWPGTIHASTAGGWGETHVVTAHSALGSLLLGLATARATVLALGGKQERKPESHGGEIPEP